MTGITGNGLPSPIQYGYDADGRRIKQTIGSSVTNYLWDEASPYGDVVRETDGNGVQQASYVLGGSELLSQSRGGTSSYYLYDGQSNVRALSDASGNITDRYNYTAFGQTQSRTGSTVNPYQYAGQQFDAISGLYDMRARYYNPNDGHFLSQDTANFDYANPVELNRYNYVAANPINYTDPTGHFVEGSNGPPTTTNRTGGANEYTLLLGTTISLELAVEVEVGLATGCLYERLVSVLMAASHDDIGLLDLEARSVLHCHIPIMKYRIIS